MSQITLLECREANAAQNNANGDWQTVLNAPQMLMPGDQVILKTAALDTRKASTGTVTLENDVSGSISGYPYVVNYLRDGKEFVIQPPVTDPVTPPRPADFARYFAADLRMAHTGDQNAYKVIQSLHIVMNKLREKIPKSSFTMNYKTPPPLLNNTIVNAMSSGKSSSHLLPLTSTAATALSASNGVMFIKSTQTEDTATFTFDGSFPEGAPTFVTTTSNLKAGVPFFVPLCTALTSITVTAGETKGTVSVGTVSASPGTGQLKINVPKVDKEFVGSPTETTLYMNIAVSSNTSPSDITFDQYSNSAITSTISGVGVPKYTITPSVSPATADDSHFTPQELTHNFTIPAGTYEPEALCSFINSSITLNNAQTTTDPVLLRNDLMKSSTYRGAGVSTFFVSESNAVGNRDAFTFSNDGDRGSWMGSSSIQLGINTNTNCFEWQYLHTPYYDSLSATGPTGSGNPAVLYQQNDTGTVSTSVMMGIALTSLTPSSFWEDQLGFDVTYATYSNSATPETFGSIGSTIVPVFKVGIGSNTTAQFVGTDSVVEKKTSPQAVPSFTANQYIANDPKQFVSTTNLDNFLPVKATTAYTTLAKDTTGYFLLDVQTNFKTETVGSSDTSRTIQAVVGRFYNTGSFTIAGSDSGIVYQHVGAPQMIQSLSIRILHPDGTLADDVGNDSTLYFEIQRQIK